MELIPKIDNYYLDYKNVDHVTKNLDGSLTISYFNKLNKNLPTQDIKLSGELYNGWKNIFANMKTE